MKRVLCLIIALSMTLSLCTNAVYAAREKEEEETVGTTLYYANDFEAEKLKNFTLTEKTNRVAVEEDKKGNKCVAFEAVDDQSDFYADFSISGINRYLVVQFDLATTKKVAALGVQYKDGNNKAGYIMQLRDDGTVKLSYGGDIAVLDLRQSKWTNIALVLDFDTNTLDAYVDEDLVAEDVRFGNPEYESMSLIRFYCAKGGSAPGAKTMIDNLLLYEGKEPREIDINAKPDEVCKVEMTDDAAKNILGDNVALSVGGNGIYYGGEKHAIDAPAYIDNGRTLVPVRALSEAFGLSVEWDNESRTVTVDGKTKITIDSNNMILPDGSSYTLDVPAKITSARTYLPLRALCEKVLGKTVSWDDHGLIVVGDKTFEAAEAEIVEANNYLIYDRPLKEEILALFESENGNSHPRVLMNAKDKQELIERYKTNETVRKWGENIIAAADKATNTNLPVYTLLNGQLLNVSRTVYNHSRSLSMAYVLTGDTKYTDALYKKFEAAGNFPDWNPSHFLDVGEMTTAFAIGYDWCYDAWTDEQKKFLEDTIYNYGVLVGHNCYYSVESAWWLPGNDTNWNVVCNGGITIGSIAIFDKYPEMCADNIAIGVRNLEVMMNSFYPEGAWHEGIGYWSYTLDYSMNMFSSLIACFGTDFNLSAAPGFAKTPYYPLSGDSPVAMNNYHDSSEGHMSHNSYFWWADRFGETALTNVRLYQMDRRNIAGSIFDMLWYNPEISGTDFELAKDFYQSEVESVSMRGSWVDDDTTFIAFHGGSNNVNHGHIDAGTFVVDMLGERWASDLAGDDYALYGYFGDNRYKYYRTRPEGHNLYVINPDKDPGQDKNSFSKVEKLESGARGAYSVLDLSNAYAEDAEKARRGYMLGDDRRSVTVRDEITFKEAGSEIYWFMHTKADVEILDNNTAILSLDGKQIKAIINTNLEEYELKVMDAVPLETSDQFEAQNKNEGFRKLTVYSKKTGKENYIQIKLIAMTDPNISEPVEDKAIDSWTIPEGEVLEIPTIDMLYADGEPMEGFNPTTTSYSFTVPADAAAPTQITAEVNDKVDVKIEQSQSFGTNTVVTASLKEHPQYTRTYVIANNRLPILENIGEYARYQAYRISASSEPEAAHPATNAFDNSSEAESRWTSSGREEWLQIDLGEAKTFNAIGVSMWKGDSRKYKFSIRISEDGKTWTEILTQKENGATEDINIFALDKEYTARYVRYVGFGNSVNDYNNVNEFAILKK